MEKQYKVEVFVTHIREVWAEDEDEAKEKGEMQVFEEVVRHEAGELITGYRVTRAGDHPVRLQVKHE